MNLSGEFFSFTVNNVVSPMWAIFHQRSVIMSHLVVEKEPGAVNTRTNNCGCLIHWLIIHRCDLASVSPDVSCTLCWDNYNHFQLCWWHCHSYSFCQAAVCESDGETDLARWGFGKGNDLNLPKMALFCTFHSVRISLWTLCFSFEYFICRFCKKNYT